MLGYDVPLGGPVSRRTALRFENVQAGVSRAIETDVNLSSAKSAFAPFGRTGRGGARAKVPSGEPFSGIFTRRNSKAILG